MIKRKKELVEYARRLKLASLAEHMTEIIHEAQEKQPTYSEFLFSCLAKEVGERDRKSFLSRIKVAGLPARHTLDDVGPAPRLGEGERTGRQTTSGVA